MALGLIAGGDAVLALVLLGCFAIVLVIGAEGISWRGCTLRRVLGFLWLALPWITFLVLTVLVGVHTAVPWIYAVAVWGVQKWAGLRGGDDDEAR